MIAALNRRLLAALAGFVLAGAAFGGAVRAVAVEVSGAQRAAFVLVVLFALSAAIAAARSASPERACPRTARLIDGALTLGAAALVAAAAMLVTGGALSGLAAAAVPAAGALLAAGSAHLARTMRLRPSAAVLWGTAVPLALAASVFVADPWIEWDGPERASVRRADIALSLSPIAAITSPHGGVELDWQRQRLMYDGPGDGAGSGGLSVIGQYYPCDPPATLRWSAVVAFAGTLLLAIGGTHAATLDGGRGVDGVDGAGCCESRPPR